MADDGDGTLTSVAAADAEVPAKAGQPELPEVATERYAIEGEHARGGLGRIVRARDVRLGRPVALKELQRPGPAAARRFEREARLTARLQHPGIVPVYEAGRWPGGEPFYAMRLVTGQSLREVLAARPARGERLALLPNLIAVAEAVAYAHGQGIVHRDLKPANILVGPFGETVVVDWGLARDLAEDEPPGGVEGTPGYMAPEQAAGGAVDERADVFALGAILHHLIGDDPGVPRDLRAIATKAMAPDPADRYPSAREVAEELRRFQTGQLVGAHVYSAGALIARWVRRHRLALGVAAVLALALAVTATVSVARILEERNAADAARHEAEARAGELLLLQARTALERDPTATLAWLKAYLAAGRDVDQVTALAAEAWERGVARHVLTAHRGMANHVVWAPGLLASAGLDGAVLLWDAERGQAVRTLRHTDYVGALAVSADGKRVASAGGDRVVRLWSEEAGEVVLHGHKQPITALAFTPDGQVLASADYEGTILVWKVAGGRGAPHLGHEGLVASIAFSPDGAHLASAGVDGTVRLWQPEVAEGVIIARHPQGATHVAFSPDGRWLASAGRDGGVRLSPLPGGAELTLSPHRDRVERLAWLPGGERLVSAGRDGRVQLHDVATRQATPLVDGAGELYALAVAGDGRIAAAGQAGLVRVWDERGALLATLVGHGVAVHDLAFSPDGVWLASAGGTVRIWPAPALAPDGGRALLGHTDDVLSVAFGGDRLVSTSKDGTARLWTAAGEPVATLAGHTDLVYRGVFLADGRRLATASFDGTVRLWNTGTGAPEGVLAGPGGALWELVASPRQLAAAGPDGKIALWDQAGGAARVLAGHAGEVRSLAFSPDGAHLASAGSDRTVRLWDVASGKGEILGAHGDQAERVAFSPDGRELASCGWDGTVRRRPLGGGKETVLRHEGMLRQIAYRPDGALLASAGSDGRILLWNDRGEARALTGHRDLVTHLAFSPDGRWLASASLDGTARLWDVASGQARVLRGHRGYVLRVAFSPGGESLATAGTDRAVRLWSTRDEPVVPATLPAIGAWLDRVTTAVIDPQTSAAASD